MQHALTLAGSKLKYGADAVSVQLFRTGDRPPPPVKRTRRGPMSPTKTMPPLAASTPLVQDKEKEKDKLLDFVAELTRQDKDAANKDPIPNPSTVQDQPKTTQDQPKDSEPQKPEKQMTEAEKRREVWQVANELMEPPPNCLSTQDFWGMHRDRRRVYTGILKTRIGYTPGCYIQPCLLYTSPSPRDRG